MYRVAVCEDDPMMLAELCGKCGEILDRLEVEHELCAFALADELWKVLDVGDRFDLLCLDILMPGITGMQLARRLREQDDETSILFISGSPEFLLEGYAVRPLQYLMKPLDPAQLEEALRTDLRLHHRPQTVTLRSGSRTEVLPLPAIRYVESRDHGCVFCMEDGERFFWINLAVAERLLPKDRFCRCHNSFLVNMGQIREAGSREIVMRGGGRVPVGRRYTEQFQRCFVRYLNARSR